MGTETQTQECPDVFRADSEAHAYLKLASPLSFQRKRRKLEKEHGIKIRGIRSGGKWLFHRQQLDAMAKLLFDVTDDE